MSNTVQTARRSFRGRFGDETYRVISRVARNWSNDRIERDLNIPVTSIAAYRANLTRDAYYPFAYVEGPGGRVVGECF